MLLIQFVSVLLISLIMVSILLDVVPIINNWWKRIKIGSVEGKDEWNNLITKKGVKWLIKTPKIKVTDNERWILLDILKGNYTKSAIQHWQEASLVLGISEYLKYNGNVQMKNTIIKYLNKNFDSMGQWKKKPKYVDAAILAYAIMKLDFIDVNKYKESQDFTWELIKEQIGQDGTVEYRRFMKNYRYVDTIGFICPFLISYGLRFNKSECIELAIRQIKQFEQNGMFDKQWIPFHAYDVNNNLPLGLYGWGRGLGWYAIGLVDAWNELPQLHKYKSILEDSVVKLAKSAINFQQSSGNWNWTVGRNECRADSSTTATLGWFMLNASKVKEISNECLVSYDKALNYLMKVTRKDGTVDFSQGDTKDIGVYSMSFNKLPFTQGFCIRMINYYQNQRLGNYYDKKIS